MERIEIFFPFKKISTILQSYQHYILERSFSERGGGAASNYNARDKSCIKSFAFLTPLIILMNTSLKCINKVKKILPYICTGGNNL